MSVVSELRCTSCLAPIDPSRGAMQRCVYCGTTLVLGATAPAPGELRLEDCGPNKIQCIRVIREHTGLGLKEAKDLAEGTPCVLARWEDGARLERFRAELVAVGARASHGAPLAASQRAAPDAEPAERGVFLEDCGANKIAVIKVIRKHTGLGLREAKELADSAPCLVGEDLGPLTATDLRFDLRDAGARVH